MKVDEVKQLTNKALEELAAALESGHSEALTAYLKTMSLFSKYSLNNLFLIASQRPDARGVAGYQSWRKLGRHVRKSEKGIAIIAPLVRRNSDEKTEQTNGQRVVAGFKIAHIFSKEQTDGKLVLELGTVTGDLFWSDGQIIDYPLNPSITLQGTPLSADGLPSLSLSARHKLSEWRPQPRCPDSFCVSATAIS